MSSFTERMSELLNQSGKSQAKVAQGVNISRRAFVYYLSGEREPPMSTLIALADYFNVSLDYLVGRSDVPDRH